MKTIHKLVLKAYLGPMVLTFFIVMFVLMMNFVWRYIDELVGKGLSAGIIIELMSYAMANMIPMGLPLSMLLAAIMTMGNLGENYELLAMKSAGMSLVQITKPLIIVVSIVAVGSFFISNNLVPYSNKKMFSIIYDIRQQKQSLEFQDGLFFNGIDNMSIRVSHQDPETHLLTDVLIYDNRAANGNMNTIVADSGYIRLSDDKKYLLVTLYHGETYEQTRSSQWFTKSALRHHTFDLQKQVIPMDGFAMGRSDADMFSNAQTKNINELQHDIDSLEIRVNDATTTSYEPLLKEQIFARDNTVLPLPDSLQVDKSNYRDLLATDSLPGLPTREKEKVWNQARTLAKNSRNMFAFDESTAKEALNQLYRSKIEWHRKISLPVSILIFFLIGAPLGAIIRRGGLGLPVVVSVIFFVIYYVISLTGEKMAKEGTWDAIYGMWISTFILTPIAVYLTYKATNDSALLDTDWYAGKIKALREKVEAKTGPLFGKLKNTIKFKKRNKRNG
ncbi:MAG TPA: LptF/LptG family permease [Candidatus Alistipes intestinigallinarum]|uniref:LptF/LptG family permease n=1 Tax=Candidatus Alistipes intestinigallinarum TaxID=2838440 RepID=A0A9D1YYT6_9BACT|nr:LptF/LptG family permease [Candidatus Alistipes intestinigallinarum]